MNLGLGGGGNPSLPPHPFSKKKKLNSSQKEKKDKKKVKKIKEKWKKRIGPRRKGRVRATFRPNVTEIVIHKFEFEPKTSFEKN